MEIKANVKEMEGAVLSIKVKDKVYDIAKFGYMEAITRPKNGNGKKYIKLFVKGNSWAGEPIAFLADDNMLMFKGSIYAKETQEDRNPNQSVGESL